MPLLDKFGEEIEHHIDFPVDLNISNIEFGAGRNNFGKREYPKCYLTDLTYPEFLSHFKQYENYSSEDCHYLDNICDFFDYNFQRKFDNLIFCNPFHYGFDQLGTAKKFFNRVGDLLNENGQIHIIGKSSNKFCRKESFDKFQKNEIDSLKSKYNFKLESFEILNEDHLINTTYTFYMCKLKDTTTPNEKLVIKKI